VSEPAGSPRADRLGAPSWLDGRLVLGVVLVLVSVLLGAKVLAGADSSQAVWVAAHDLAPGTVLADADLRTGKVRLFGTSGHYVAGAKPVGYVVHRGVSSGELLPVDALGAPGADVSRREVTVPVQVGHLPPDLTRGEQVDVYVTPDDKAARRTTPARGTDPYAPRLVLRAVTVARVVRAGGLGTSGQDQPVVLSVDPSQVIAVVQALADGRVDLVRVPRSQQQPLGTATPAP
jgi:hypothetical protein